MVNLGFWSLWSSMQLSDPQYYLVPIGLTVIGLVELLRQEIPTRFHDPLRYAGALAILVSPCFEIVGGSWIHLMSLMVLSVLVIMLAIGLRVKTLIHTGVAFLLMDLAAMVIRTSIDNTGMLWCVGLLFGAAVIAIALFLTVRLRSWPMPIFLNRHPSEPRARMGVLRSKGVRCPALRWWPSHVVVERRCEFVGMVEAGET